jgi:hypothetical protein
LQPGENAARGYDDIIFQWDEKANVETYYFNIYKNEWKGEKAIATTDLTTNTTEVTLPEGKYVWGVYGDNGSPRTLDVYHTLYVDLTAPGNPNLSLPEDEDTITSVPVDFSWNRPVSSTSPIYDSIWISADSNFVNDIILIDYVTDPNTTLNELEDGHYYWKVRSVDAAGNKSEEAGEAEFWLIKE